jgi:hypothetical protein
MNTYTLYLFIIQQPLLRVGKHNKSSAITAFF